jgi:predicted nuclease with RNAse H fold
MYVIGVDLSGPSGTQNTDVAVFAVHDEKLRYLNNECDGSDVSLLGTVQELSRAGTVVIGLDAPLSYEPGGGQRARDAELRKELVARGMRPGSIMAPTAPRMVYLTLRGLVLAQVLTGVSGDHPVRIAEVHPGGALCLRGAPLDAVRSFAKDGDARDILLDWMAGQSVTGVVRPSPCSSHFVAACAAALAAWDWHCGRSQWLAPAQLPWHPFDFAS